MNRLKYLTLEDLLGLVRRLGVRPVRDLGLLDAAVARPQSSAFGEDAYPTFKLKAAALLPSIVTSHALVDGNKGLGRLAATVFLDVNGEPVDLGDDDAFRLVLDVAEGRIGVEEIASLHARCLLAWSYINQLRDRLEPISRVTQKEGSHRQIDDEPHSHRKSS